MQYHLPDFPSPTINFLLPLILTPTQLHLNCSIFSLSFSFLPPHFISSQNQAPWLITLKTMAIRIIITRSNGNAQNTGNGERYQPYIMGPLIEPPPDFTLLGRINFNSSAIGRFVGMNPPPVTFVQHIVRSIWMRRDDIRVHRTGLLYVFECKSREDLQGLLRQQTTIFDER